jgi:hypothetical protein
LRSASSISTPLEALEEAIDADVLAAMCIANQTHSALACS